MFKRYYPYARVSSVFAIDYEKLYVKGFRGIIFDIDNTLVHHGDNSNPKVVSLFESLHRIGFTTVLLSNNSEERILRFIENIETFYVSEAAKPGIAGYAKALGLLGLPAVNVVCIGDQLFTDVLGANRCGIPSILVDFIRVENETKIGIRRHLERMILKFYEINKYYNNRLGDIEITERTIENAVV